MATLLRHQLQWKPTAEYAVDPWANFVDSIRWLQSRGARFVTFSDAIAGRYDPSLINIILDHHIDDYPLETEAMCRWELEQGIRSSVYLFNRSTSSSAVQEEGAFALDDLDLRFYRRLEAAGFEIGYHHNAVGRAREERLGRAAGTELDDALRQRAAEIFADDVRSLRDHFDIRTFIPHGGGQGNYLLTEIPSSCVDLVWVYNAAASSPLGARRPKYSNWTDTAARGVQPQVIAGKHAYYLCRLDNLRLKAALARPGLHHVLIHAGRFGRGMPEELFGSGWSGDIVQRSDFEDAPTGCPGAPLSLRSWITSRGGDPSALARRIAGSLGESIQTPAPQRSEAYRLLTDDPRVLVLHLLTNAGCMGHLANQRAFNRKELGFARDNTRPRIRTPRPVEVISNASEISDAIADFGRADWSIEPFTAFFNQVYSQRLFQHLQQTSRLFDVIQLRHWSIDNADELRALLEMLNVYHDARIPVDLSLSVTLSQSTAAQQIADFDDMDRLRSLYDIGLIADPDAGARPRRVLRITSGRSATVPTAV